MSANTSEPGYFNSPVEIGVIKVANPYTRTTVEEDILLKMGRYVTATHVVAIQAYVNDGGYWSPYGQLTVNLSDQGLRLGSWEVSIKDWSENKSLAEGALRSRFFGNEVIHIQGGGAIARIMPGSLPVQTLWESTGHFGWRVTALEVIESIARDALMSGDCVALTLPSGIGVGVNVCSEGGLKFQGIWRDGGAEMRDLTSQELSEVFKALQNGTASVTAGEHVIHNARINSGEPFRLLIDRYMERPRAETHQQQRQS